MPYFDGYLAKGESCVRIFGFDEEQHNISAREFALCVPPSLLLVYVQETQSPVLPLI